jgi:ParB family chromosome partitioning protein
MSANNRRGLGKGLESLLSSTTISSAVKQEANSITSSLQNKGPLTSGKSIVSLSVADIIPNPNQPRHKFNDETLSELSSSIKDHGIAQPILVRKKGNTYELIAGERRWRASKLAGLTTVPAIIKEMSDEESLEIAIIENIQREDLNVVDEAESYKLLMKKFNLTQEQVAVKVGKSRSAVANTLRLLELPERIKTSLFNGEITSGHARAILSAKTEQEQIILWENIKQGQLTVRSSEKIATGNKNLNNKKTSKTTSLINIEHELSSKLSTRVSLSGDEHKGKIEINYFSKDDLERILEVLA